MTNLTGLPSGAGGQFIYETDIGRLWWDADGAGGNARISIADFTGLPTLTAADFTIVV